MKTANGYVIINDTHFGLRRSSVVTAAALLELGSAQANHLQTAVERANAEDRQLLVLGDLFDHSQVSYTVFAQVWQILSKASHPVIMVRGNHDLEKDRTALSAFDLLCRLLGDKAVVEVTKPHRLGVGCWVIPHMDNQTAFDRAVASAVENNCSVLLAHANYDNPFAVFADHSLNLTAEQAAKFDHVILGHEHNRRDLPGLDILGAPFPCNIGECSVEKGFHIWDGPGAEVHFVETYSPAYGDYAEIDWHDLPGAPVHHTQFIRVVGTAEFHESTDVLHLVDDLRKRSKALFISNAVTVNGIELQAVEDATASLETFNAELMFWQMLKPTTKERIHAVLRT